MKCCISPGVQQLPGALSGAFFALDVFSSLGQHVPNLFGNELTTHDTTASTGLVAHTAMTT